MIAEPAELRRCQARVIAHREQRARFGFFEVFCNRKVQARHILQVEPVCAKAGYRAHATGTKREFAVKSTVGDESGLI